MKTNIEYVDEVLQQYLDRTKFAESKGKDPKERGPERLTLQRRAAIKNYFDRKRRIQQDVRDRQEDHLARQRLG